MSYKKYYFYSKIDKNQEPISSCRAWNRLDAAEHFASIKRLTLKEFLSIFSVSR